MRVLIVEDDNRKAAIITRAVEAGGLSPGEVGVVPDAVNARERLSADSVDLLLLDLQIPNRFGDGPNRSGGTALVHWLLRRPTHRLPQHIIAITSFDMEDETVKTLLSQGIQVLRSESSQEDWKAFITGFVRRVASVLEAQRHLVGGASQHVTAALLTAVDVETEQVRRVFGISTDVTLRGGVNWYRGAVSGSDEGASVVLAQSNQMGMPAASVLTMKALTYWRPDLVVMSGICAGIRGEVSIGDVIVPDPCWDYGSGKLVADGTLRPDPRSIELRERVRSLVQASRDQALWLKWRDDWPADKPKTIPTLHIRPAASGPSVVADTKTAAIVQGQSRKVVGIDMENYGVYYACSNGGLDHQPAFLAIKAVVDFADPEKEDMYQSYGAYLAAKLSLWVVQQWSAFK